MSICPNHTQHEHYIRSAEEILNKRKLSSTMLIRAMEQLDEARRQCPHDHQITALFMKLYSLVDKTF